MQSSGHSMALVLMSSQQLAHLHKDQISQKASVVSGGVHEDLSLAEITDGF